VVFDCLAYRFIVIHIFQIQINVQF
jgi:hypothetical protein